MAAPRKKSVARIVAVAGGKGGVGKSTVAANLSLAIGRLGHRVALVDADLGAANLHTMMGALHPRASLADFLDHNVDNLDEVRLNVAPNVDLIPGASRPGSANLPVAQKLRLIRAIARLDADCIVVDVGAGTSYTVVDLVGASDLKLFVVAPQLPSLHNAYALLKACVHRVVRKLSDDETQINLIDSALANETRARTIVQLLAVLRPMDPSLVDLIEDTLSRFGAGLVGNMLTSDSEVGAMTRMSPLINDHLRVSAPVLAAIRRTNSLAGGLRAGTGTLATSSDESFASFRALARTVLEADLGRLRGEARQQQTMPLWVSREDRPATAEPPPAEQPH
ncbi:MAG: P-loop NTPase [Myxococcales bacterium]|nr:P-loop NTPase [Myxococcales bacterium]